MNRREFVSASAAFSFATPRGILGQGNPYPEQQYPQSARGRSIAQFARSLEIRRGTPYVKRPECTLTVDIYSPRDRSDRPLPAVLAFGLSAFKLNATDYRRDLDRLPADATPNLYPPILARNRVVAVANLRVSSQAMWPAQIHDAKRALQWLVKNAGGLGIDVNRIGLIGASASGNLSALVALTADTVQLDDPSAHMDISTKVKAVCSISGIYDFEYYEKVDAGNKSLFVDVLPLYLGKTDRLYREASPSSYVRAGAPPFFMTHGFEDQRVPYSQMTHFAELLARAGIPVQTLSIHNFGHGLLPGRVPDPGFEIVDSKICEFFKEHLDVA